MGYSEGVYCLTITVHLAHGLLTGYMPLIIQKTLKTMGGIGRSLQLTSQQLANLSIQALFFPI